jgi:hypothetical protein
MMARECVVNATPKAPTQMGQQKFSSADKLHTLLARTVRRAAVFSPDFEQGGKDGND